jgi:hypothetical protein
MATDPGGKQKGTTIGTVQLYTVAQAREKAREVMRAVRSGEGTGGETFMSVAGAWLKRHVVKNGLRTRVEIERVLAKYIFPKMGGPHLCLDQAQRHRRAARSRRGQARQ